MELLHKFRSFITIFIFGLVLIGCAGGSRGTGVRTVTKEPIPDSNSRDFSMIEDLVLGDREVECAIQGKLNGVMRLTAEDRIISVEERENTECFITINPPDKGSLFVEVRGIQSPVLRLVSHATPGSQPQLVRECREYCVLSPTDIPRHGWLSIELKNETARCDEIARIQINQ